MNKIDVIMQGPFFNAMIDNTKRYIELDYVNKVIISTWEDTIIEDDILDDDRVILVRNKYPENYGGGNLNLQIVSSLNGIKKAESDIVVKMRTDQQIPNSSFKKLYDFYNEHKNDETIEYLDGTKQKSKIFVLGNASQWPYHPQDHMYWGYKQDVIKVFDIPHQSDPPYGQLSLDGTNKEFTYENGRLRGVLYLGIHYYSKFYPKAQEHFDNHKLYLHDDSPKFQEALDYSNSIRETIFRPFPRIDMYWEKYNSGYWYGEYERQGEYYAD